MPLTATTRPLRLLLAVVAAMFVTLAVDVYGAIITESSTEDLVGNSFRGVYLVEDLRWQVHKLAAREAIEAPAQTVARIDADIAEYTPLATFENEDVVWRQLRGQLDGLREEAHRDDRDAIARRAHAVSDLVDQLVTINVRSAAQVSDHLSALRRREIMIDVVVVLLVAGLLLRLGVSFNRTLRREAELVRRNFAIAQEQNRELEAFAGRAAHDLRAPLNPIRGFSDLIVSGNDSPAEMQRMGALIAKAVSRMSRVIDDMLELSRSGHALPGTSSLRVVVASVLDEMGPELRDADVKITTVDATVACRDTALEQILRNLVGNSAKYRSPERRLQVALSARIESGKVLIEVVDNGTGMDADAARHAFDPFFRARPDVAGTGLGLAIVDRIARAHGGACALDSSRDHGTTVTVAMPLAGA